MYLDKGEMVAIGKPDQIIEMYKESFREEYRQKMAGKRS